MSNERISRDRLTRDTETRPTSWKPADLLPDPKYDPNYEFRYVRKSTMGQTDPTNMSRSLREGWEPCKLADHPELMMSVDAGAANSGLVEVGGLVLCKMPIEMWEQRQAYYRQQSGAQIESVDAQLDKMNDPRMPLFKERNSKVTFGSGR